MNRVATFPFSLVGGVPITPSQVGTFANGKLVNRDMDLTLPHPPNHVPNPVTSLSIGVFVNGKRILRETDLATCGHPVTNGELGVYSS